MLAKRHYQVKKKKIYIYIYISNCIYHISIYICKLQSIYTKRTMGDKKLYRKKRTIVIKQKVWLVWGPSGYLN